MGELTSLEVFSPSYRYFCSCNWTLLLEFVKSTAG
ncbi:hypothetical protein N752_28545 [Desulforamulus aquiferis]|nr:hypothetical protein N752_28545 [Desulforamulus aquiferis]